MLLPYSCYYPDVETTQTHWKQQPWRNNLREHQPWCSNLREEWSVVEDDDDDNDDLFTVFFDLFTPHQRSLSFKIAAGAFTLA
jgi:hypothetical protein